MKAISWLFVLLVVSSSTNAQTYKVLWSFGGAPNDGAISLSNLVMDGAGNLYGTAEYGGSSTQSGCIEDGGCGTVFELSPSSDGTWSETVLYNFCTNYVGVRCLDGQWPVAGLVFDQEGDLYGTTSDGGTGTSGYDYGTVFELSPPSLPGGSWSESVLYNFCAGSNSECQDGADPTSQLTFDADGNLYGTTSLGGANVGHVVGGTVFELSPTANEWSLTTLYSFCANSKSRICPDGDQPQAGVTFDKAGNLYGTTMEGGTKNSQGAGTVFELSPGSNGWSLATLLSFNPNGGPLAIPVATVTIDSKGDLYSTASGGDTGGVFQLQRQTRSQRRFLFNGNNGAKPTSGVLLDLKGTNLYGTTSQGGNSSNGGVVYRIGASKLETILYTSCQLQNCADGQNPYSGLIEDQNGNLYGTTKFGGANGLGVVFEITQ
jgi:uncharacterized repeat protein (TIGR03803 family)